MTNRIIGFLIIFSFTASSLLAQQRLNAVVSSDSREEDSLPLPTVITLLFVPVVYKIFWEVTAND